MMVKRLPFLGHRSRLELRCQQAIEGSLVVGLLVFFPELAVIQLRDGEGGFGIRVDEDGFGVRCAA
jgi:hypothetical protein